MAELKASVILDLVDRISRPVQRIERQFASLGRSRGLQQLRRSVANVGQQFGGVVSASGNLTRRLAVMGGTAAGAVWGFERLVGGVTDTADAAIKTADRLGVPLKRLQEWRYGAERSGIATRTFDMALQRFTRRAAEAASGTGEAVGALDFLNIQLKDANGNMRPTTELLPEVADALSGIEDPALRVRAAFKLFDSEGVAMLSFLEGGSQGMRDLAQEAHNAGVVMDEAFARQAVEYNDTMMDFRRTLFGVRLSLVQELLPALTEWLKHLKSLTQGNRELITRRLLDGLRRFWEGVQAIGRGLAWTADLLGGWGRLAGLVATIMAGPLILSAVQLGLALLGLAKVIGTLALSAMPAAIGAVRALGVALLTTPVGWVIAAIAAIAGAAYLIYRYWEPISAWFRDMWASVTAFFEQGILDVTLTILSWSPAGLFLRGIDAVIAAFTGASLLDTGREWIGGLRDGIEERWKQVTAWVDERLVGLQAAFANFSLTEAGRDLIGSLWDGIEERFTALSRWLEKKLAGLVSWMPDWAQGPLGLEGLGSGPALGGSMLQAEAVDGALMAAGETRVGGELRITIDSEGRPRVDDLRRDGPMELDVDVGDWRMWQ